MHKHHRKRLKERFLREGLSSFEPHNALELLLFYSIPQKDTNETAHALIERFGSLSAVFEAPFPS
jgi:DNA repair protein RadC